MKNFSPKYILCNLAFEMNGKRYEIGKQYVNQTGVLNFSWNEFNPVDLIGKQVTLFGEMEGKVPVKFAFPGYINCENTEKEILLGISLFLEPDQAKVLNELVAKNGTLPTYIRNLPRLPFNSTLGPMPSRALLEIELQDQGLIVCADMENISPNGIQVSTEDQRVFPVLPGEKLLIELQPRGENQAAIELQGKVMRILQVQDPKSKNIRSYLGLATAPVEQEDGEKFVKLLKDIVSLVKE